MRWPGRWLSTVARPPHDGWGIQCQWVDADGRSHRVAEETVTSLRQVIGTPPDDLEDRAPLVVRPGGALGLGPVRVICEDGSRREVDDRLPDDFPLGYHRILSD